jgi:hypothetical protein
MKQIEDRTAAPAADDSGRQAKLSLKEIRTALGEAYKPILTVEGTEPAIYIGHRILRRKDGTMEHTKGWHGLDQSPIAGGLGPCVV